MSSPQFLLAATDFSEAATAAVRAAAHLSAILGTGLRVLHVVDTFELEPSDWPGEEEIDREMEALTATLSNSNPIETKVAESEAASTILREAEQSDVVAVVAGYSGKSGFLQRIGSTASKVARRSRRPVFILAPSFNHRSKVIGCLDFSETSRQVIEWTRKLTGGIGHEGHFAHVAIPLKRLSQYNLGSGDDDSPIPTFGGSENLYRERLLAGIRNITGLLETDEIEIGFHDSPEKGLEALAVKWFPALLVIGRTEHNSLHDRLIGSTAERILNYTGCSTLVVAGKGIAP